MHYICLVLRKLDTLCLAYLYNLCFLANNCPMYAQRHVVPVSPWVPYLCNSSQAIADVSLPHERLVDAGKDTSPPPPPRPITPPSPLVQPSPSPAPPNEDCDRPSPDYIKCCWKIDACVKIWGPILAAVIGLPAALGAIKALCPSYWPFGERPHQVPHTVPHTDLPDGLPSCRESVDHREAHVSVVVNMGK
jgi:hypothetical protein